MLITDLEKLTKKLTLMKNGLRLNLGSGLADIEDQISIDIKPLKNVDIVWNVDQGLPFSNDSVEYIKATDFLEHILDLEFVLKEMYRISKHGALWIIRIPHFSSDSAASIQHKHFFTDVGFQFFSPNLREVPGDNWNYGWNIWLETIKSEVIWHAGAKEQFKTREELEFAKTYYRNVIDSIHFELKVIKK